MRGIKVWTARMGLQFYSQVRLETGTRNSIFNGQHAAANSWRTQKYWPGIWQQHYQGSRIYKMLHSFHTCDAHVGKTSQNCLTICFHVAFLFNDTLRLIGGQSKGIFTMRSAFRKAIVLTDMLILKCMSTAVFIFPHQTVIWNTCCWSCLVNLHFLRTMVTLNPVLVLDFKAPGKSRASFLRTLRKAVFSHAFTLYLFTSMLLQHYLITGFAHQTAATSTNKYK